MVASERPGPSRTFQVTGRQLTSGETLAEAAAARLDRTAARLAAGGAIAGALLFAAGRVSLSALAAAVGARQAIASTVPTTIIARGSHVVTEAGESREGVAGIVWRGPPLEVRSSDDDDVERGVAALVGGAAPTRPRPRLALLRPEGVTEDLVHELGAGAGQVLGAGTAPGEPILVVRPGAPPATARVVLADLPGAPPLVRASPATRMLTPLATVTEYDGQLVLRLGDEPALASLTSVATAGDERPVLAVLATAHGRGDRPELLVRMIRGVHPGRRGLVVDGTVGPGTRMALGRCDGAAARADLERTTRMLARSLAGSALRFGLYFDCAGRSEGLHGKASVDARIIRGAFPDLPFAGMGAAFEIAPHDDVPELQLFTGVLGIFTIPS